MTQSSLIQIQAAGQRLLSALAETMAEAARRSGGWLVCRLGCIECCLGSFAITQFDALRLREGLVGLETADPTRAQRVRTRAAAYIAAIAPSYPGNTITGELHNGDALPESMEDTPCPALDPETGGCDLYDARPIACRVFGPVTRTGDDTFAACELCYVGATPGQMAQCAVEVDPEGLECEILGALNEVGLHGMTIVAYALSHCGRPCQDPAAMPRGHPHSPSPRTPAP